MGINGALVGGYGVLVFKRENLSFFCRVLRVKQVSEDNIQSYESVNFFFFFTIFTNVTCFFFALMLVLLVLGCDFSVHG